MDQRMPISAKLRCARLRTAATFALASATLLISGCGRDMHDLQAYVAEVKLRKAPGIESLPEIKPYEKFEYQAEDLRNPFDASVIAHHTPTGQGRLEHGAISPDPNRSPEFLESFPLDTLRMVGTLEQNGQLWALVKTPDATVQRVAQGDYMGQNNGKITLISDAGIQLMEIIPDGFGGWHERESQVALSQ
jgi:type IV pilus assembly protein PilP